MNFVIKPLSIFLFHDNQFKKKKAMLVFNSFLTFRMKQLAQ